MMARGWKRCSQEPPSQFSWVIAILWMKNIKRIHFHFWPDWAHYVWNTDSLDALRKFWSRENHPIWANNGAAQLSFGKFTKGINKSSPFSHSGTRLAVGPLAPALQEFVPSFFMNHWTLRGHFRAAPRDWKNGARTVHRQRAPRRCFIISWHANNPPTAPPLWQIIAPATRRFDWLAATGHAQFSAASDSDHIINALAERSTHTKKKIASREVSIKSKAFLRAPLLTIFLSCWSLITF